MTTFNRGWLVTYTLLCAGLMLGGFASGQVSDFSMRVIGGTDCDSQDNLKDVDCEDKPDRACNGGTVSRCNQEAGNGTKVCQSSAGAKACKSSGCVTANKDKLTSDDANGNPCTPVQLSGQ